MRLINKLINKSSRVYSNIADSEAGIFLSGVSDVASSSARILKLESEIESLKLELGDLIYIWYTISEEVRNSSTWESTEQDLIDAQECLIFKISEKENELLECANRKNEAKLSVLASCEVGKETVKSTISSTVTTIKEEIQGVVSTIQEGTDLDSDVEEWGDIVNSYSKKGKEPIFSDCFKDAFDDDYDYNDFHKALRDRLSDNLDYFDTLDDLNDFNEDLGDDLFDDLDDLDDLNEDLGDNLFDDLDDVTGDLEDKLGGDLNDFNEDLGDNLFDDFDDLLNDFPDKSTLESIPDGDTLDDIISNFSKSKGDPLNSFETPFVDDSAPDSICDLKSEASLTDEPNEKDIVIKSKKGSKVIKVSEVVEGESDDESMDIPIG